MVTDFPLAGMHARCLFAADTGSGRRLLQTGDSRVA
jgi:hypothetical protein